MRQAADMDGKNPHLLFALNLEEPSVRSRPLKYPFPANSQYING